jgi:hypothetical protein
MEISLMKEQFLYFIIALIIGTSYGYLSHDLMNGILTGVFIGIGFVIGNILVGKRRREGNKK